MRPLHVTRVSCQALEGEESAGGNVGSRPSRIGLVAMAAFTDAARSSGLQVLGAGDKTAQPAGGSLQRVFACLAERAWREVVSSRRPAYENRIGESRPADGAPGQVDRGSFLFHHPTSCLPRPKSTLLSCRACSYIRGSVLSLSARILTFLSN